MKTYTEMVNATDRSGHMTFADRARVPAWIRVELQTTQGTRYFPKRILDYGSGKHRTHARRMMRDFPDVQVDCYDIGANYTPEHVTVPFEAAYNLVYASNVLNVQPNLAQLRYVLNSMEYACKRGGAIVFNFPEDPRKSDVSTSAFEELLLELFGHFDTHGKTKKGRVYSVEL